MMATPSLAVEATSSAATAGGGGGGIAPLTSAMARGDEAAWREFHRLYFARLHRYAVVVARGDDAHAADLVQLTLLRAVRHVRRFDDEAVLWSWLTCLARCAAADEGRKRARRLRFLERLAHWQEARRCGPGADPAAQRMEALGMHLAALPPDDRALLEGKYFDRQSHADLASAHGLSTKAVEPRLARLRAKLRAALGAPPDPPRRR